MKNEKQRQLEDALDEKIQGFSFDETPLRDVVAFFKSLLGEGVDFYIDPVLTEFDVLVTLTLNKVTLRQALRAMLRPRGLDFVVSPNGYVFISTLAGCRLEEARPENLSFRQYDVSDILVQVKASGFLALLLQVTGRENWDVARVADGEEETAGILEREVPASEGPGRVLMLRGNYLIVNHVARIHKKIEEVLAELRAGRKLSEPEVSDKPSATAESMVHVPFVAPIEEPVGVVTLSVEPSVTVEGTVHVPFVTPIEEPVRVVSLRVEPSVTAEGTGDVPVLSHIPVLKRLFVKSAVARPDHAIFTLPLFRQPTEQEAGDEWLTLLDPIDLKLVRVQIDPKFARGLPLGLDMFRRVDLGKVKGGLVYVHDHLRAVGEVSLAPLAAKDRRQAPAFDKAELAGHVQAYNETDISPIVAAGLEIPALYKIKETDFWAMLTKDGEVAIVHIVGIEEDPSEILLHIRKLGNVDLTQLPKKELLPLPAGEERSGEGPPAAPGGGKRR